MTRIPLASDLKTRTGAPSTKDARQVNSYMEIKGEQTAVRKRPAAQGGIAVGTGTAQGGIGLTIGGVPTFIGFWGDTLYSYSGSGTSWSGSTSYVAGDHVAVNFVDYWARSDNTNSQPPSSNWSRSYVPRAPVIPYYFTSTATPLESVWIIAIVTNPNIGLNAYNVGITVYSNYANAFTAAGSTLKATIEAAYPAMAPLSSWGVYPNPVDNLGAYRTIWRYYLDNLGNVVQVQIAPAVIGDNTHIAYGQVTPPSGGGSWPAVNIGGSYYTCAFISNAGLPAMQPVYLTP